MSADKLRRRIAIEAARLLERGQESSLGKARLRAARSLKHGYVKADQFPSETEIRDELERSSYVRHGDARFDNLRDMRLAALQVLRSLQEFSPRLTGDLVTGAVRSGGVIQVVLDPAYETALRPELERLIGEEETSGDEEDSPVAIDIEFSADESGVTLAELEDLLRHEYPDLDLNSAEPPAALDRFQVYRMLLAPLAHVQQRKSTHPEGDALYHSLQVFERARQELPYDEEFLLAALLHDVGKGIDPLDHVRASLDALGGYVSERTLWFIEHLHEAQRLLENDLGARAKRRLHEHADYEELLLLARCDRAGRVSGGAAPELDEALELIRDLARECG